MIYLLSNNYLLYVYMSRYYKYLSHKSVFELNILFDEIPQDVIRTRIGVFDRIITIAINKRSLDDIKIDPINENGTLKVLFQSWNGYDDFMTEEYNETNFSGKILCDIYYNNINTDKSLTLYIDVKNNYDTHIGIRLSKHEQPKWITSAMLPIRTSPFREILEIVNQISELKKQVNDLKEQLIKK
jgi:hypothetical protein